MRTMLCSAAALAAALTAGCAGTSPTDASAPPLTGTSWRLVVLNGRETLPGVRVTAVFGDDERVTGSAGCNRYFGNAAVGEAGQLSIGMLGSTRMHCGDVVQPQEDAFLSALEHATSYRSVGGRLELGPAGGAATLVFSAE